jgi:predicted dehydrogenase
VAGELRLGLIGAGRWGRNYITTIAGLEGVRLASLASRNPQSARLAGPDCLVTADWHAILDRSRIDAAIVATPPALHAEMTAAAVKRGLPVLVEKPLTLDLVEAVALRGLVAAQEGFVMVDHTHLFHPAYRALKLVAPRYGPVHAIDCRSGNYGPFRADTRALWDWGAHDLALCLDLVGASPEILEAKCLERRRAPEGWGEVLELRATFPRAVSAVLRFGNLLAKERRMVVYLERAVLVYDDGVERKLTLHPPSPPHTEPATPGEPLAYDRQLPLACVVSEFARAVRASSKSLDSLDLGVEVVRLLDRCEAALPVA